MLNLIDFTYQTKHKLIDSESYKPYEEHKNLKNVPHYNLLKDLKDFQEEKNILEKNLTLEELKKESKVINFTLSFYKFKNK